MTTLTENLKKNKTVIETLASIAIGVGFLLIGISAAVNTVGALTEQPATTTAAPTTTQPTTTTAPTTTTTQPTATTSDATAPCDYDGAEWTFNKNPFGYAHSEDGLIYPLGVVDGVARLEAGLARCGLTNVPLWYDGNAVTDVKFIVGRDGRPSGGMYATCASGDTVPLSHESAIDLVC